MSRWPFIFLGIFLILLLLGQWLLLLWLVSQDRTGYVICAAILGCNLKDSRANLKLFVQGIREAYNDKLW